MSYKTILVHVDDSRNMEHRIQIAARLALAHDAHLIGAATTGVSRLIYQSVGFGGDYPGAVLPTAPELDVLRQRGQRTLQRFEDIVHRAGVRSYDKGLIDDEAAGAISLYARSADLVVLGQFDPDDPSPSVMPDFVDQVILRGASPVLVIPYTGRFGLRGDGSDRILIGWNAGIEAARAVRGALPLLQRASVVKAVSLRPAPNVETDGTRTLPDLVQSLSRQNVPVSILEHVSAADHGKELLSLAMGMQADFLVLGCYGHTRFKEILLGGVSRTILASMTVPVVTMH